MDLQIFTLPSPHPDARRPFGPQARDAIHSRCPRSVKASRPVLAFQILTVSSALPVASLCPSGSHASDVISCECRSGPTTIFAEATSQIFTANSLRLVEANRVPSGLQARFEIEPTCPRSVTIGSPAWVPEMV